MMTSSTVPQDYKFSGTKAAVKELIKKLSCVNCGKLSPAIYNLGVCDHIFCRSCCKSVMGKCCPMPDCRLPTRVCETHLDRSLSTMASLSLKLQEAFNEQNPAAEEMSKKTGALSLHQEEQKTASLQTVEDGLSGSGQQMPRSKQSGGAPQRSCRHRLFAEGGILSGSAERSAVADSELTEPNKKLHTLRTADVPQDADGDQSLGASCEETQAPENFLHNEPLKEASALRNSGSGCGAPSATDVPMSEKDNAADPAEAALSSKISPCLGALAGRRGLGGTGTATVPSTEPDSETPPKKTSIRKRGTSADASRDRKRRSLDDGRAAHCRVGTKLPTRGKNRSTRKRKSTEKDISHEEDSLAHESHPLDEDEISLLQSALDSERPRKHFQNKDGNSDENENSLLQSVPNSERPRKHLRNKDGNSDENESSLLQSAPDSEKPRKRLPNKDGKSEEKISGLGKPLTVKENSTVKVLRVRDHPLRKEGDKQASVCKKGSGKKRGLPNKQTSTARKALLNKGSHSHHPPAMKKSPNLGEHGKRGVAGLKGSATPGNTLEKKNAKGETPLHVAAIKGDLVLVQELLKAGATPNTRDNAGWTPLHEAVNQGWTEVACALLKAGACVNTPGPGGDCPLHDAIEAHRISCVSLLVSHGATLTARNLHGKTPQDLAVTDEMKAALKTPVIVQPSSCPAQEVQEDCRQLCLLGSGLTRDQKAMLAKMAASLQAKVADDFSPEVTHLVTSVNEVGACPRTLKFLHAVLAGCWIVSAEWLTVCQEYGHRVSEEGFEVSGASANPASQAPQRGRLNRLHQLPGLFAGCQFYLRGEFTYPSLGRSDLSALVTEGKGHLLTREPRLESLEDYEPTVPYHASPQGPLADCSIFIVVSDECCITPLRSSRIAIVPATWIKDSIATFTLQMPPA